MAYLLFAIPGMKERQLEGAISDPRYLDTCNDCAYFIFVHMTPDYSDTPENREYLSTYADGRPLTVELLQQAWAAKKRDALLAAERPKPERAPDLDSMSDAEIDEAMHAALRERAKQVK